MANRPPKEAAPGTHARFPDEGIEEWRCPGDGGIVVSVVTDGKDAEPIGVGDRDHIVWLSVERAEWVRARLAEALLAVRGRRNR